MKTKLLAIKAKNPSTTKEFKSLLPKLKQIVNWTEKPAEIYYCIINDIKEKQVCNYCGNDKTFYGNVKGYSHTCGSKRCAAKYNYAINTHLPELFRQLATGRKMSEESKKKLSEKAKVFNSDPAKIEKTRKTVKAKYGVDNVFQLEETKQKAKETCLKKYGVEFNTQRSEIKKLNSEFMYDMLDKVEEEFGTRYLMQIPEYFEKAQKSKAKSKFKTREFTFSSGRKEIIQGYEDKAINDLLNTYDESELVLVDTMKPKINYKFENKNRRYYCDIWIPKDNLVIEVKSEYTMLKEFEKNLAKAVATKKSGYNYKLMVY